MRRGLIWYSPAMAGAFSVDHLWSRFPQLFRKLVITRIVSSRSGLSYAKTLQARVVFQALVRLRSEDPIIPRTSALGFGLVRALAVCVPRPRPCRLFPSLVSPDSPWPDGQLVALRSSPHAGRGPHRREATKRHPVHRFGLALLQRPSRPFEDSPVAQVPFLTCTRLALRTAPMGPDRRRPKMFMPSRPGVLSVGRWLGPR